MSYNILLLVHGEENEKANYLYVFLINIHFYYKKMQNKYSRESLRRLRATGPSPQSS